MMTAYQLRIRLLDGRQKSVLEVLERHRSGRAQSDLGKAV